MGLLPKGYDSEAATTSSGGGLFIKLNPGENKIRILDVYLLYQTWSAEGKPIRYRAIADGKMQKPRALPFHGRLGVTLKNGQWIDEKWKHVWMCLVWSYADGDLKVLEIPQSTVQNALAALDADEDWGDLSGYDVKVVKAGEKLETTYSVIGIPPKPLAKNIKQAFETASINLDAMIFNCYPDDEQWADKALEKLLNNIELASAEARERGIELEVPTSTDLEVLQGCYERAMDLMSLQTVKESLPAPTVETVEEKPDELTKSELESIPF